MNKIIRILSLLAFVAGASGLQAQGRALAGTVKDTLGNPLQGVKVSVEGKGVSTLTDASGAYSLILPDGSKIVEFSLAGYKTKKEGIGQKNEISVVLKTDFSKGKSKGKTEARKSGKSKGKSGEEKKKPERKEVKDKSKESRESKETTGEHENDHDSDHEKSGKDGKSGSRDKDREDDDDHR